MPGLAFVTCLTSRVLCSTHDDSYAWRPRCSRVPLRTRVDHNTLQSCMPWPVRAHGNTAAISVATVPPKKARRQTVDYTLLAACVHEMQNWTPAKVEQVLSGLSRLLCTPALLCACLVIPNLVLDPRRWCSTTGQRSRCDSARWRTAGSCTYPGTPLRHGYTSAVRLHAARRQRRTASVHGSSRQRNYPCLTETLNGFVNLPYEHHPCVCRRAAAGSTARLCAQVGPSAGSLGAGGGAWIRPEA